MLGNVVDLDKGLFFNRKYGVIKYSIDLGAEKKLIFHNQHGLTKYRGDKVNS
jgi:hypothetical protein